MTDQQPPEYTIVVQMPYALWPGDGYFAIKISGEHLPTQFVLVDRDGGRHELAPYRVGMLGRRR